MRKSNGIGTTVSDPLKGYSGEDIKPARALTWRQVQAALPKKGQAAIVPASAFFTGWLARALEDPSLVVKPREEWPLELPSPKVRVDNQKEWHSIVEGCLELGIWKCLKPSELI